MEVDDIIRIVLDNTLSQNISHIVISGGEPTMQTESLIDLLKKLKNRGYHTTIETNATLFDKSIPQYTDLVSMSPKLSSSTPWEANLKNSGVIYKKNWAERHERDRINIEAIQQYINGCKEFGKDLVVMFSGGTDSEIVLRSFLKIGIVPRCCFINFVGDYNIEDRLVAQKICDDLNVDSLITSKISIIKEIGNLVSVTTESYLDQLIIMKSEMLLNFEKNNE
jgi:hypothetical protein